MVFLPAALAGALMLAGSAPASTISTANYQGEVATDGVVAFDAKVRDGVVRRINGDPGPPPTGLTFEGLPLACDEGTTPQDMVIVSNLRVRRHRFRVTVETVDPETDGRARIRGHFTDDFSAVSGFVRAFGSFGEGVTNCDTGRLSWTAAVQTEPEPSKPQLLSQDLLHHLVRAAPDRP
jgi:hypothetical protein